MNPSRPRAALLLAAAAVSFTLGCGRVQNTADDVETGQTPAAPTVDPLAQAPCTPWRPSDADWSSLAMSRPAVLGAISASPSGRYLYSVGSWWESDTLEQSIVRSPDLGETWCVVATPAPVTAVAPSPASETVLYAVSAAQGASAPQLLKTNDGGATWSVAALPSGVSGDLATSFTDSNAVWLNRHSDVDGHELSLSVDGGASWTTPIPPAFKVDLDSTGPVFVAATVDGFLVDPSAGRRLLAWGKVSTFDIRIPASSFEDGPTRWFSSDDTGSSWRELPSPPKPFAGVVVDAASTIYLWGTDGSLRSRDWGETWQETAPLPAGVAQVTVSTLGSSRSGRLFAWDKHGFYAPIVVDAWRSNDAGASWQPLNIPADPAVVPVLAPDGGDTLVGRGAAGLANTTNGGKGWHDLPLVPVPDYLAESPIDGRLWANEMLGWDADGETFLGSSASLSSTDGGLTWTPGAAVSGPLFMDGASADRAFSGDFASNGSALRTEDGGRTWAKVPRPEDDIAAVGVCAPPNSCMYLLMLQLNVSPSTCSLATTRDAGRTWTEQRSLPTELCQNPPPTLTVAADDPQHLLAGCGDAICESRDGGISWKSLPFPAAGRTVGSPLLLPNGAELVAVTETAQQGENPPFALARSSDGGATWKDVLSIPDGVRVQVIQSIARPSTLFAVSLSANAFDQVFRSDDAGLTWRLELPSAAIGAQGLYIQAIVDQPRGGFAAMTQYGLVRFE